MNIIDKELAIDVKASTKTDFNSPIIPPYIFRAPPIRLNIINNIRVFFMLSWLFSIGQDLNFTTFYKSQIKELKLCLKK